MSSKKILVIDAQGGGLGKQIVSALRKYFTENEIIAVGTNSMATSAMLKAGADSGATGENSVVVCCKDADVIIGPIGIVIADSMRGEITQAMANAVSCSRAKRYLLPVKSSSNIIVGTSELTIGKLLEALIRELKEELK